MSRFTDLRGRNEPPLPAWGTPRLGEPAHGYLLRLGSMNGVGSISVLLNSHGLNGRALQPAECLDFALSFPIEGKEQLVRATPVISQTAVLLMGQQLRRRDWQISLRRFCPACLAENPYHRVWWDLPAFARCPDHDIDILDRDVAGRPLPWWSPSFTHSPLGGELMRYDVPRRPSPRISVESYILGRLGVSPPISVPMLDCFQGLGQSLAAVELFGRIFLGGALRVRPTVDTTPGFELSNVMSAGFQISLGGESALVDVLKDVLGRRDSFAECRGGLFGWLGQAVTESEGEHTKLVASLMHRAAVEQGSFSRGTSTAWQSGEAGWIPVPTLAIELGLTERAVRRLSEIMGFHKRQFGAARARYRSFSHQQAETMRHALESSLNRSDAAAALGVSRDTFSAFVSAGYIAIFARPGVGLDRDRFRPEDVAALAAHLLRNTELVSEMPCGYLRLANLRRTSRTDPALSVRECFASDMPLRWRVGPTAGDVLIADPHSSLRDKMEAARAALHTLPGLSFYQAATILGCSIRMLEGLVEMSQLRMCSETRGWRRIDPATVEAFGLKYASPEIYFEYVDCRTKNGKIGLKLVNLGIDNFSVEQRDGSRSHMIDRSSAATVLSLAHDPDDPNSDGLVPLEAEMLRALGRRGSFKLVSRSRGITLCSAAGHLTVQIKFRLEQSTIEVVLTRGAGSKQDIEVRVAGENGLQLREVDGRLEVVDLILAEVLTSASTRSILVARIVAATERLRSMFSLMRSTRSPADSGKVLAPALSGGAKRRQKGGRSDSWR